jgi:hypothetical protein
VVHGYGSEVTLELVSFDDGRQGNKGCHEGAKRLVRGVVAVNQGSVAVYSTGVCSRA